MLAALVVTLGFAGTASANSISMVWLSSSGGAIGAGTPTLTNVAVSDTAVLEIRVTVGAAGVTAAGVTFMHDGTVDATAIVMCPVAAGNPFGPGACGTTLGPGGFGALLTSSSAVTTTGGLAGGIQFTTPPSGQSSGTFQLAHITFHAAAAGTTGAAFFRPGLDGVVTLAGGFSVPTASGATISVIPEPGTIALLAMGLGALAFAGRRR